MVFNKINKIKRTKNKINENKNMKGKIIIKSKLLDSL